MNYALATVVVALLFLIIGSIVDSLALIMAVKYKMKKNYVKSKMFYRIMLFAEKMTLFSFYAFYAGAFVTIVKFLIGLF